MSKNLKLFTIARPLKPLTSSRDKTVRRMTHDKVNTVVNNVF